MRTGTGTPSTVGGAAAQVLSLLDEMARLYERAAALGEEAAASADAGVVLDALRRRQPLVDQLAERDGRLAGLRERGGAAFTPEERSAIERRLAQLADASARLSAADTALQGELTRRRDELADELASVGKGRSAAAAYGVARGPARATRQDTEV